MTMIGHKHSEETKLKMSKAPKDYMKTPEYRAAMRRARKGKLLGSANGMFGKKHSGETKMKMHLAAQERDPSTRKGGHPKGRITSEQTKEKMRLAYIKRTGGKPKDKKYHSDGYAQRRCPGHPRADKQGWVLEHRLVMEKQLGRYLQSGEIVHHIDGNRTNNALSNLQLTSPREHKITYRAGFKEGIARGFMAGFLCAYMRRNK